MNWNFHKILTEISTKFYLFLQFHIRTTFLRRKMCDLNLPHFSWFYEIAGIFRLFSSQPPFLQYSGIMTQLRPLEMKWRLKELVVNKSRLLLSVPPTNYSSYLILPSSIIALSTCATLFIIKANHTRKDIIYLVHFRIAYCIMCYFISVHRNFST